MSSDSVTSTDSVKGLWKDICFKRFPVEAQKLLSNSRADDDLDFWKNSYFVSNF